ncbi:MAG: VIT and VWA domain-containing protein [Bryobacteraceae bacterium]|nr:VIT and VWA domain-containing protein [Bryobacteraceae bacterium]
MKRLAVLWICSVAAWGDAGVLLPGTAQQPDTSVLALEEMAIDVTIANGHARVLIRQIYANRTPSVQEGTYIFALPGRALISDFAVWDDATRIPGVILERKLARELYQDIRAQAIDPGLLQMGERDIDEARRTSIFTAKVVPIPPNGFKRIEIEYQERLPVERMEGYFAIPLRPDMYRAQTAGRLWITLTLQSHHTMDGFEVLSKAYSMRVLERGANQVKLALESRNTPLTEDFALKYKLRGGADSLQVAAYRDGTGPGFFEASSLIGGGPVEDAGSRTVIALFDASLSMQWEKLERSYQALEALLRSLRPGDRFNVILFNSQVAPFASAPQAASPETIEKALAFLKSQKLRGGTNLTLALETGLSQSGPASYLVLISDGGATEGGVRNSRIHENYARKWSALPAERRPRTYVYGVGDDANGPLLKLLARQNGVMEWVRSTEPAEFKLNAFLSKIGRSPVPGLSLAANPPSNFTLIYPLEEGVFPGSMAQWVGQYANPGPATFQVGPARRQVTLPAQAIDNAYLPRAWAKARVDALLQKIDREGEDAATIDEIIRLSRKYKFVTPYTSFLAAPRALLRPRLIRPGDPVLRVRTDAAIVSVVAMFPFGLTKPLRFLPGEDVWQTRFLAPADLADGAYPVRLLLRDRQGRVFRESKTFVIASKPPVMNVKLDKTRYRSGETIRLAVQASESARTITARLYGAPPAQIRWNARAKANTGEIVVPAHLAAGRYRIRVTAEDFAHNIASQEVTIEVAP